MRSGNRVLITGIAGFVGANLAARLVARGALVHGLVREHTALWRLTDLLPSITLHSADLTDGDALHQAIDSCQPELIYHMAVGRRAATPAERAAMLVTNVAGTLNLLEAARACGCRRVVHAGSSLEYGPRDHPTRESDQPAPRSFFGATKAAASIVARQFAEQHGLPFVCLRLYSVYGYWEGPARLVPTAMCAAMGGREIALTQPGYARDFVFVDDVVDACLMAADNAAAVGQIFNIGSGVQSTNEQVVDIVESLVGRPLRRAVGSYGAHETDTAFWMADNAKARQLLNWTPTHTLAQGLAKTWTFIARHRELYDPGARASPTEAGHAG